MKKKIISVEIILQGFKHQSRWLVRKYFLIHLCKPQVQKLAFKVKSDRQAQETNTSKQKTTHSNKRQAIHYCTVYLKTSVKRKDSHRYNSYYESRKTKHKQQSSPKLSLPKTFKISRKNTGINDNMIVQLEKVPKFPPCFLLGTNHI